MNKQTMDNALRWLLTAFALVLVSVLQDVILCRVRLFGATSDLVCGALLLVCIMMDPEQGCIFILLGSVAYHFSGTSPGPYVIALLTGIGLMVSITRQAYLQQNFAATFLCTGIAIFVYEMLLGIIGAFLGHTTVSRLGIFALSGAYTVAAIPVLYPIFRGIGKIGGETWKD